MATKDKICTIGYLVDTFSQYAPGALSVISSQSMFLTEENRQLCPMYYQIVNSQNLAVPYRDGSGRYVSIYFNGQPGNFPRLSCKLEHTPSASLGGGSIKYSNHSLVCEEDIDYVYTQHKITIISKGIPLNDTDTSLIYFTNSAQAEKVSSQYNTKNDNSTVVYTLLSGLVAKLRFNAGGVKNIDDFNLSTFKYTVIRGYTSPQQYDLFNQQTQSWNDIVINQIEEDITIEIVANKGETTFIKVLTDRHIKVEDTQTGMVIVDLSSRSGNYRTSYANNMNFNLRASFDNYSKYTKMNYKISFVNNYVSELIMEGNVDVSADKKIFFITSGDSSGDNTIGINQTVVGTYQIVLSTVAKVERINIAFWVIPFPEEYKDKTQTQIQFYHGDNTEPEPNDYWQDDTMIYPIQLTEDESRRKKISKITLKLRKGSSNYANDYVIKSIKIGTTANNGPEYEKTGDDRNWVYFEVTDISVVTSVEKMYINILNENASRLVKMWVGYDNIYGNYIDINCRPSSVNFDIATVYNLDDNNSVITPKGNAGTVTVNASPQNKQRFRFKVVASTYDTTTDVTDYEPKIFLKTITGNSTKPYIYTNVTVISSGSFNSGSEFTVSADNLITWPQTYQLCIARLAKYMNKTLTVKITQIESNGTWVPRLLPAAEGSLISNCYTHNDKSAFNGLNSSNIATWTSIMPTASSHQIDYTFENISSGRYVSFILDFTGADINEINSYVMSRKFVYSNNAIANVNTQTPYKQVINKTTFKKDPSSDYYILATTMFGQTPPNDSSEQNNVSEYSYIYYKRTLKQQVDFSISKTPAYIMTIAEQDESELLRITKVYYKTSSAGEYQLLSENGINSHTISTDYISYPYLRFKFEIDDTVSNIELYKGYYTIAVGSTQVDSLTGYFTADTEILVQNITVDGVSKNIFLYADENNLPITMSVTTDKSAKKVPVVLVLYHTKDDFTKDGVSDFAYKTTSGTVLFQPDGTEIEQGHSFTNSDKQTCIFKLIDIDVLKAEQDFAANYWFKLSQKILSTNVSEQYINAELSVWFSTQSVSSSTTSSYMSNDDNWYKSVWMDGYQNGSLNMCGYISGDLQGNSVSPTASNLTPTVFTKTDSVSSEGLNFDDVNIWRINMRFTLKPHDNQKLDTSLHQMFIKRSFTDSYPVEYEKTIDTATGCIVATKESVFMIEIEARNYDGSAVSSPVKVFINGGGENTIDTYYYYYQDGITKKFDSYRRFFRNFLREKTARDDWWSFYALPIDSPKVSSYISYIKSENTTHIACIECESYGLSRQNYNFSEIYPLENSSDEYPWEIFNGQSTYTGEYEYPDELVAGTTPTSIKEYDSYGNPFRTIGAGDLIPRFCEITCNVNTLDGIMTMKYEVYPEIHSVRYIEFLPTCDLVIQASPLVKEHHNSFSFFSAEDEPRYVGFFRNDNLIAGSSFNPYDNRFVYGGNGDGDNNRVKVFIVSGNTLDETKKDVSNMFEVTVTRFASTMGSSGLPDFDADEFGNRYSKVTVKYIGPIGPEGDRNVEYMQPANSAYEDREKYFAHQVKTQTSELSESYVEVVSYNITLDMDGVFCNITVPAAHRLRFWIYVQFGDLVPYDFALVKPMSDSDGANHSMCIAALNNYRNKSYRKNFLICPTNSTQMLDGTYQERPKTKTKIQEINRYSASPLVSTTGFATEWSPNSTMEAVSYDVADYYPAFDASHIPYLDMQNYQTDQRGEWKYGVDLNESRDNYDDCVYEIYRRNRNSDYNQWEYYSSVLFRPHYYNYVLLQTRGPINTNTNIAPTVAYSYVPYYENQNFLADPTGEKIQYIDVTNQFND